MSDGLKLKYFVLKPGGNDVYARASREAMRVYAHHISEANSAFAHDVWEWVQQAELEAGPEPAPVSGAKEPNDG